MCLSPIRIRNPNKGRGNSKYGFTVDTVSEFINVPCGHCSECIARKQNFLTQRVQMESLNNHLFMATLTYNQESLPHVLVSSGFSIKFADVHDMQNTFKRIRKNNGFTRPFKYLLVSELGSKKGRPHFHAIISLPKYPDDDFLTITNLESIMFKELLHEWRRNYGSVRVPVYRPCCTYVRRFIHGKLHTNYDLHYINPSLTAQGCASASFYVLKYMMKPSEREERLQHALALNLPEDEYENTWSLVRSKTVKSLGFGWLKTDSDEVDPDILAHLRKSVEFSKHNFDYPVFINPDTGQTFPMSNYYTKKSEVLPTEDSVFFALKTYGKPDDYNTDLNGSQTITKIDKFIHNRNETFSKSFDIGLDWLDS